MLAKLRGSPPLRGALVLLAGIVSALAFIELAEEVLEGEAAPVDLAISQWLHRFDAPWLVSTMRGITVLGSGWVLVPVVALGAAGALLRERRDLAGLLAAAGVAGEVLNVLLKLLFSRPRPDLVSLVAIPSSYGFPSGHAMLSTVVYGTLALVVARLAPRVRRVGFVVAPVLVVVIGASRVYLGVHWASDVVAGWAAGSVLLASVVLVARRRPAAHEDG